MTCQRCGGNAIPWVQARDRTGGPAVPVARCVTPGCGIGQTLSTTRSAPSAAAPGWSPTGVAGRMIARRIITAQLAAAGAVIRPGGHAIDVGAGAGMRSEVLAQAGMRVIALEPDPGEAARLTARLGHRIEVIEAPLAHGVLPRGQANLVIAWHVLEHLPDVDGALAEMIAALRPGGRLVIAVPNAVSFEAQAFRGRWHGWEPARHQWHFAPTVLRRLLAAAGVDAIDVRAAGGWALPTSLAYSLAPGLDHQRHSGLRRWGGPALVVAGIPLAGTARFAGHGAQLVASAVRPSEVSPSGRVRA